MIQRIQSVYLTVATLLIALMLFLPSIVFKIPGQTSVQFFVKGTTTALYRVTPGSQALIERYYYGIALIAAIVLILLLTLFLYGNRKLQIKLCQLTLLLIAGLIAFIYFYPESRLKNYAEFSEFSATYLIGAYFPFLAMAFVFLARRAIKNDEDLVRASDRIR